jgi:cytochrome b6-f complex subunit 5
MIEPFLFGIVLGMLPVTLAGLFVAAYLQYRRGKTLV